MEEPEVFAAFVVVARLLLWILAGDIVMFI